MIDYSYRSHLNGADVLADGKLKCRCESEEDAKEICEALDLLNNDYKSE